MASAILLTATALLLGLAAQAEAATTVPAKTITASTTWNLTGSPYVVTGSVTVAHATDPVLTIEPGVEVRFTTTGSLTIGGGAAPGTLVANGTPAQPIRFASNAASPAAGDWTSLRLQGPASSGPSFLSHAVIEHAGRASRSSLEIASHPVTLENVTLREGAWAGVYVASANPTLRNVTVRDHAQWGIYAEATAAPSLQGVTLENLGNAPLRARLDQDWTGVTFLNNTRPRVELHGVDVTASRTLALPADAATGAAYHGLLLDSLTIRNGAAWTLPPGTRLLVNTWTQIQVGAYGQKGSLVAEGTEAQPIVLTSQSEADSWYGLHFYGPTAPLGESRLRNITISQSRDDAIDAYQYSGLTLDNATLEDNGRHGLRIDTSNPTLRNVDVLESASEGVHLVSSSPTWNGGAIHRSGQAGIRVSGCGMATLRELVVNASGGYGVFADNACGGAHLDNVTIADSASRAWRNRLDARYDVTVRDAGVAEVEYWGNTLTTDRTLAATPDHATGSALTPVILTGFEIRNGATLTIPANTTVLFDEWAWVNVGTYAQKASLKAEGTSAEPILLRSRSNSTANGWQGLYFRGDSAPVGASALRNITISQSRDDAIEIYRYGGLVVDNATLEDNGRYGFRLDAASITIHDTRIRRVGWEAGYWHGASPVLERVLVEDTGRSGFYSAGCGVATLRDVTIRRADGYGYVADNACNGAHFDGVVIEDVATRPWRNRLDARYDVTVRDAGVAEVEYWGNTLTTDTTIKRFTDGATGAVLTPVILTGFEVRNGATLTIPANTTLLAEEWVWVNIGTYAQKASLHAEGTETEPIVLRSRSNSTANGWYGLYFRGDAAAPGDSVLRNVTIGHSRDDGLEGYHYRNLLLDNVTLEGHARHGIRYDGGAPQLRNVAVVGGGSDGAVFVSSAATWRGGSLDRPGGNGVSTWGCGIVTLDNLTIRSPVGYGFYADNPCNGAHFDDVRFEDVTRPWRNRLDVRTDATIVGSLVDEIEHWGGTLTANRTLPRAYDGEDGARMTDVLLSNLDVVNGATLTLHAGTRLLVEDLVWMNFGTYAQRGSLRAEGTEGEPIVIAGRSGVATRGWYGLYFRGDWAGESDTLLRNATIAYSRDEGIETFYYRGFELDNVTLERNAGTGLHTYGAAPGPALVRATTIQRNGGNGVFVEQGTLTIHGSNLSRNGANGLEIRWGTAARVENTTFFDNLRAGVNATWGDPTLTLRRNHFWQNHGYGLDLGTATGSLIVDNAFAQNRAGQARASGLHTWNLTRSEGRNIADGPFLGGNVWSDYAGADTDGDGLGDTLLPYVYSIGPGADWLPVIGGPFADFRVSVPNPAEAPQELLFEDATLGGLAEPTRWHWSFGDGGEATDRSALHRFPADGLYAVTLTVWNDRGQSASITKDVIVDSEAPHTLANLTGELGLDDWYVSAPLVTLTGVDNGGGVASIRWRLDGGAFTNYVGSFHVWAEGEHVLDHYAIDASGNVGPTSSVAFRVDHTAPIVAPVILNGTEGRDGWYLSDVLVALNATGGASGLASLQYGFDAEPNLTYEEALLVATDGRHALSYHAMDGAGNLANGTFLILRDTTRPDVEGEESGPLGGSGWYVGSVEVNMTGLDATSGVRHLNASIDGGAWFEVNGSFTIEGEGVHTLNVTATDMAGNLLDLPARTFRLAAETPVATARLEAVAAADGWHLVEANATLLGETLADPTLEGKLPDAETPDAPPLQATVTAPKPLASLLADWLAAVGLPMR